MKKILILFFLVTGIVFHTYAQNMISGTIVDSENNSPLVGATVVIKGTTVGTIADFDGKFQIKAPALNTTLEVSFIGYKTLEVNYTGQQSFNIRLVSSVSAIDEVVVVGYGTQKKSHLTGAISKVTNIGLDQIPTSRAEDALIGKISGVSIQTVNASAGSAPTIRVRGIGSITADASPLIVMDGVVVPSNYLGNVDMNDVESVEVLKDASSAAIYGSRGGNGVIMITTKKGSEGKTVFSLNAYKGVKYSFPTYRYKPFSTVAQWHDYVLANNGGVLTDQMKFAELIGNGSETSWPDVFLENGAIENYSLSARGGNDKTKFSISGGYQKDDGVLLTDSYKKMNFMMNLSTKVGKLFEFGGIINPSYSAQRIFPNGFHDVLRKSPWLPEYITAENIKYVNLTKYPTLQIGDYAQENYFDGYILPGNTIGTTISNTTNASPLASVLEVFRYQNNLNLFTNAYIKFNIAKGLTFTPTVSYTYINSQYSNFSTSKSGTKGVADIASAYQTGISIHMTSENLLAYNSTVGKHDISAVAGVLFEKMSLTSDGIAGTGYLYDNIRTINAAGSISSATTNIYQEALQAFLGRFNYAYDNKYLVSASVRYDGSSRFGADTRYGLFPAFSAGWRVSQEDFIKSIGWISNLKIRVSYGVTGNNNGIGYYSSIATLAPITAVINGSKVSGYNPENIANPDLAWEKSVEIGPGIDLGILNNKITFSLDYYRRSTKDLLLAQAIPAVTGFESAVVNIGEVQNRGFEFESNAAIISNSGFNWNVTANLSHNTNELIDFAGASGLITSIDPKRPAEYIALEGHPISSFYGYRYEKEVPVEYLVNPLWPIGAKSRDVYVKDLNGDGKITTADKEILGSPYPTLVWGITNSFRAKSLDLSFTLSGSHGAKTLNLDPQYFENQFSSTMVYKASFPDQALVQQRIFTDLCVQDASIVALRSVNLGYTLHSNVSKKMGLGSARIYVSGQNILYFMAKGYTSFNPEGVTDTSSPLRGGYQIGAPPVAKAVTIGVNVEF